MSVFLPISEDAIEIVRRVLGVGVSAISRFPTGLSHYVYDVVTDDGRRIVVRLAGNETRDALAGGIYWHERLRAVGVPLPTLLYADLGWGDIAPVMILERLSGRDLGAEYDGLTPAQKRTLAGEIATIQGGVG